MVKQTIEFLVLLTALIIMPYQNKARAHKPEPESDPSWAKAVVHGKEHRTDLQFYLHEAFTGESATTVEVVPAPGSNQTFTGFGYIAMVDDPLRAGPEPTSKLVGRAQGLDGGASRPNGLSLITAVTYLFSDGIYNGSSLSVLGLNPTLKPERELPVVGGTGVFRMARGHAFLHTVSFGASSGIVIVGFNVTVFHH